MNAPLEPEVRAHLERALAEVTLDDKYTLGTGRAFMSGTQALVRLAMLQQQRDHAAGLHTAGFISGYRGSPLGALDQALWKARSHLKRHDIVFQPGLNEDLAATSIWGTQQVALAGTAKFDGVFSMWYGKGPGVDRCGDVFKHANAAGTAPHGGVLVLAGDDHGAKSSTLPHQSEHILKACGIPVLYPATVQEYLDLGIHGWAMSRWSGLWVAMKAVTDVVESSASVIVDPDRVQTTIPPDFAYPHDDPHGLNIRWPDAPLDQEARLMNYKWYAALAYVRHHRINRTVVDSPHAWFGIITAGKAYLDTMQALDALGLDAQACAQLGIRVFKCGCVWPLEAVTVQEFASGLDEILVVEEKRQILEYQLKEELYNWPDSRRPRIYGKFDEKDGRGGEWAMPQGQWLLPGLGELSPAVIARAIAARLLNPGQHASRFGGALPEHIRRRIEERLDILATRDRLLAAPHTVVQRQPTFCSGCPHNTSTNVPEGSRAMAGIGCHYMVLWKPERRTTTFTQMGGEGVPWIGQAPFVTDSHMFANLGDGTFFHSGLLAIRASIAAGVNITYKILYNDAVAMTGGQPVDGTLTVPMIVEQVRGEGAKKIVVVTDEPERYDALRGTSEMRGVDIHHRDHLDAVQRTLRDIPGCTILIYDQTCASEKRRRRKRIVDGVPAFPDPPRRVFINERVCEGCGDCTVQSACLSVEPVETEFGRKRRINQSSCNKDYSCVKGFCPSFVTIEGGAVRSGRTARAAGAPTAAATGAAATAAAATGGGTTTAAGAGAPAATWAASPAPVESTPVPADWPAELRDPPDVPPKPIGETGDAIYGILVTGIGGTGVVTIGQLLGMAAHLEGRGISVLDMAGLAQKGGAVTSHVQIARSADALHATRIATGEADLVLGCDLVVTAANETLARMRPGVTRLVVNADVSPTSEFMRDRDWALPESALRRNILEAAGPRDVDFIEASRLAEALCGDTLYTNPMLLGFAYQRGWLPLSREALVRAIELNGQQIRRNLDAFAWGRRIAADADRVRALTGVAPAAPDDAADGGQTSGGTAAAREADTGAAAAQDALASPAAAGAAASAAGASSVAAAASPADGASGARVIELRRPVGRVRTPADLDRFIERRAEDLVGYQGRALARRYRARIDAVRAAESAASGPPGAGSVTEAVARNLYRLLAYKDEYEVARLHADPAFRAAIDAQFEGRFDVRYLLAPPTLERIDPVTGRPVKRSFGPWIGHVFPWLARMKFLRGTPFDPFGRHPERREERALIAEFEADVDAVLRALADGTNRDRLRALASWPDEVRGYGPVKTAAIVKARALRADRLSGLQAPPVDQRLSA